MSTDPGVTVALAFHHCGPFGLDLNHGPIATMATSRMLVIEAQRVVALTEGGGVADVLDPYEGAAGDVSVGLSETADAFVVTHEGDVVRFYDAQGDLQFERPWNECDAHIVIPRGGGVLARSGSLGPRGCVIEQLEPLSPTGEPLSTVSVDGVGFLKVAPSHFVHSSGDNDIVSRHGLAGSLSWAVPLEPGKLETAWDSDRLVVAPKDGTVRHYQDGTESSSDMVLDIVLAIAISPSGEYSFAITNPPVPGQGHLYAWENGALIAEREIPETMRALGGVNDWGEALLADSPDPDAVRLSLVDPAGDPLWVADVAATGVRELRVARDGSGFSAVIGEHLLGWTLGRPCEPRPPKSSKTVKTF